MFPLVDNMFGKGKSTFGRKFLAQVERFIHESAYPKDSLRLCDELGFPRDWSTFVVKCLAELRKARTLFIRFQEGDLVDSSDNYLKFFRIVQSALRAQWFVILPKEPTTIRELLSSIPGPVFFVFDKIGAAFKCSQDDSQKSTEMFYEFATRICTNLAATKGVYFLLSGRARFLRDVGQKPQENYQPLLNSSPGVFRRIN